LLASGAATMRVFITVMGSNVRHIRAKITVFLLILAASCATWAEIVEDLYGAMVSVPDVSQEALVVASREALSQVLVKVTGTETVLQAPAVVSALNESRNLVQRFAYAREDKVGASLSAHFEFESSSISNLIQQAGQPFWTANRPVVLAWIVVEGPHGRKFLSEESMPEHMASFSEEFGRRGLPFQMPLYDISDAAAMSPDKLWSLRTGSLRDASQRYGGKDILAGRVAILSNGDWVGDWTYLFDNSRVDRTLKSASAKDFFQQGSALLAQQMSARFAVTSSADAINSARVKVSGVTSYSDYARVVEWLQGLELIDSANISSIHGDVIRVDLSARADAQSLAATIELNSRLKALLTSGRDEELSYQWLK
jgi:hypothetical protein